MAVFTSKRLQASVLDTMRMIGEPMSVTELSKVIGKSRQAVRHALQESGAVVIDDSRPVLWALPEGMSITKRVPGKHNEVEYVVSTKASSNFVDIWNKQREKIGASITGLAIEPSTDPGDMAVQLGSLAGSLAALAYDLEQVKNMPDWYEILTEEVS
jgi:hypothetical protein